MVLIIPVLHFRFSQGRVIASVMIFWVLPPVLTPDPRFDDDHSGLQRTRRGSPDPWSG